MKKDWQTLLIEGINSLRQEDEDINRLIAPHTEDFIPLLSRYIEELLFFNPAYGLVGTNDPEELIIKHILDSLSPIGIISRLLAKTEMADNADKPRIADAGSGAGLPGIPLAIAMHNCNFTLIERMGRRAGFLLNAKAVLGISNINIEESELEKTTAFGFSLVTFRAFKPLEPKLLASLFRICENREQSGIIAAYKGKSDKIEHEMKPLEKLCRWEAIPCHVPFLHEKRHIVVIRPPELK